MIEAAHTHASAIGIWALVLVGLAGMGVWLIALTMSGRQERAAHHPHLPDVRGPVVGGTHVSDCGRSVAPSREAAAEVAPARIVPTQRGGDADEEAVRRARGG